MINPRDPDFNLGEEIEAAANRLDELRQQIVLEFVTLNFLGEVAAIRPELLANDGTDNAFASAVGIIDAAGEGLDKFSQTMGIDAEIIDDNQELPIDADIEESTVADEAEADDEDTDDTEKSIEADEADQATEVEVETAKPIPEPRPARQAASQNGHSEAKYEADERDYGSRVYAPTDAKDVEHIDYDNIEVIIGVSADGQTLTIEHGNAGAGIEISGIPTTITRVINLAILKQGRPVFKVREADKVSANGKFNGFTNALRYANSFLEAKSDGAIETIIEDNGQVTTARGYQTNPGVLFLDESLIHKGSSPETLEPTPPKV